MLQKLNEILNFQTKNIFRNIVLHFFYFYTGADLQPCIAQSSQQRINDIAPPTSITDFQLIKKLGSGTFAVVYLAKRKLDDSLYAIKCINKSLIIKQNEVKHTNDELKILLAVNHPFIVKLHAAFQNNDYLFLVLDYMKGGELFHHLQIHHRFSERQVTYWAAQILLGLQELHKHGIIMRDLKPENLLLDSDGYIKITDFGLSKYVYQDQQQNMQDQQGQNKQQIIIGTTFCGTSEYLSPELLRNQPHTIAIDLWALGIITYELIQGIPPFYQQDNKAMFKQILKSEVTYTDRFSAVSRDFISKLLQKDPKKRMTSEQAKKHLFFRNIDFEKLSKKEYEMEFIPAKDENKNFDKEFIQEDISNAVQQFENEQIDDASLVSLKQIVEQKNWRLKNKKK